MSNQQKSALYVLVVGILAILTYLVLLIFVDPNVAPAAMAILALTAATPLLFSMKTVDERERHLARRAAVAGGTASYLFLVAVCMIIWLLRYRSAEPTIAVTVLPQIVMGACVVLLVVRSATLLVLTRRPLDLSA